MRLDSLGTELFREFTLSMNTSLKEQIELDRARTKDSPFLIQTWEVTVFCYYLDYLSYFQSHVTHKPTFIPFSDAGLRIFLPEKFPTASQGWAFPKHLTSRVKLLTFSKYLHCVRWPHSFNSGEHVFCVTFLCVGKDTT